MELLRIPQDETYPLPSVIKMQLDNTDETIQ